MKKSKHLKERRLSEMLAIIQARFLSKRLSGKVLKKKKKRVINSSY